MNQNQPPHYAGSGLHPTDQSEHLDQVDLGEDQHIATASDAPYETRFRKALTKNKDDSNLTGETFVFKARKASEVVKKDEVRVQFEWDELPIICSHYDLGTIRRIYPVSRGSRKTPKCILATKDKAYLLKRSPLTSKTFDQKEFTHQLQTTLVENGYPTPALMPTSRSGATLVKRHEYVYEIFDFIPGQRFQKSIKETTQAGLMLGKFHQITEHFLPPTKAPTGSYHKSSTLAKCFQGLPQIMGNHLHGESPKLIRATTQAIKDLEELYHEAAARVEQMGYKHWPQNITHGDWHPGNILFGKNSNVSAVLDYDSARQQPSPIEIANGAFQFSVIGGMNPEHWPDAPNSSRLNAFFMGYRSVPGVNKITREQMQAIPWLFIETMIAEILLPITARGYFAHVRGDAMLQILLRKAQWYKKHHEQLISVMYHS